MWVLYLYTHIVSGEDQMTHSQYGPPCLRSHPAQFSQPVWPIGKHPSAGLNHIHTFDQTDLSPVTRLTCPLCLRHQGIPPCYAAHG